MNLEHFFLKIYYNLLSRLITEEDKDNLLKIWKNILKGRLLEEAIVLLASNGRIKKKWIFSGIGQEGGQAVVTSLLSEDDWVLPSVRGYVPVISKGFPLRGIAAEIFGKKKGPLRGVGLSTSFTSPEYKIAQHSDIVGIDCATALGIAMALKRKIRKGLIASFFGDGAATRGSLWSSLNISVLQRLPIFWICENNHYSVTTHVSSLTATPFYKKAEAFGLKAMKVEGNNPLEAYFLVRDLLKYIRTEKKPAFLEIETYRFMSHDMFFMTSQHYQDETERKMWLQNRDPVKVIENQLEAMKLIDPKLISVTKQNIKAEIDEALEWAGEQEELSEEELLSMNFL